MRIAIDGTTLCLPDGSSGAGIEHYSLAITCALLDLAPQHQFFITTPPSLSRRIREELLFHGSHVTLLPSFGPKLSFVSHHLLLPLRLALRRCDVLFSPFGQIPLGWRGRSVVTVHDLAIYERPEWFPESQAFSTHVLVPRTLSRANRIIAVSHATERALHKWFPATKNTTIVIHEGVNLDEAFRAIQNADETSTRFPFDREFILFLGTVEPRKNLVNAFRAFHAFLQTRPDQASQVRFIVAGKKGWHTREIEEELLVVNQEWKRTEPHGVIQFLGPVTEEEKWILLARAACLLYPSLNEGFGLPLLEAMAVGTPVIASNRGALPEVGGDAAVYVEPEDTEAMSLAIAQCLLVPEGLREIRELGIRRASEFRWDRAAKETLKALEEVGARSKNEA